MKIQFLRVLGQRSQSPAVVAVADDHLVRWRPTAGWSCDCNEASSPGCPHIPAVGSLIDPKVTGKETP